MAIVPAGSLLLARDDFPSAPVCLLKDTDGNDLSAPTGVTIPNGCSTLFQIVSTETGQWGRIDPDTGDGIIYGNQFDVVATITGPFSYAFADSSNIYFGKSTSVTRYNVDGTVNAVLPVGIASGSNLAFGAIPDGFFTNPYAIRLISGNQWLVRYDSSTGARTDLVNFATGSEVIIGSAQCIAVTSASVSILVALENSGTNTFTVRRYDTSGTLQSSYTILSGVAGSHVTSIACNGLDNTSFWIQYYDGTDQHVTQIRISDGATLKDWTIPIADASTMTVLRVPLQDVSTCIPAGSLMISGYGDSATARYIKPDGTILGQPASAFILGSGIAGIERLSGNDIAVVGANAPNFSNTGSGVINGADITLKGEALSPFAYIGGFLLGVDAGDCYYTGRIQTQGTLKLAKFDSSGGTALQTWDIAYSSTLYLSSLWDMCVSPDGSTAYVWLSGKFSQPDANKYKIHIFSLVGAGSYVGKLDNTNYSESSPGFGSLQADPDGNIIAVFRSNGASGTDGVVRRYSPAGSILNTYTMTGALNPSPMGAAIDETGGGFWVWAYDSNVSTSSGVTYWHLRLSDGSEIDPSFAPEEGDFEFDSPFTVLGLDVGTCSVPVTPTPVPNPTPAAPQTDCTPQTQVSGGGVGNAGCNTGGVGWTSSYAGPYGSVPVHSDPADGESLQDKHQIDVWIELVHTDSEGAITKYRRAFKELGDLPAYYGGRKTEGLKAVGDVEHGLGNEQGTFEAASVNIAYADQVDRTFRDLLETEDLEQDEVRIYAATPEARAAGGTPHVMMRAAVTRPVTDSPMEATITAVDALFADYGPFGPNAKYPPYLFSDLGAACPYMPQDVAKERIPVLYGEKSDEGARDPVTNALNPKGLCPGYFVGKFALPSDIITTTPTTGRSFEELVAAFEASAAAGTLVADFAGDFGAEISDLQDLYNAGGGIPNYLDGLAAAKGVDPLGTAFNGVGYSDIAAWQAGGTTTTPPNEWGLIVFGLRPWYRHFNIYASDLGGGNPNNKHDRAAVSNLIGREDMLVPGYNWPFATQYVELTNPETGKVFWLDAIWVRGPLLDDHINGVVNITCNAIGNEDEGDGTGLPLIASHDCEQDWLENFVLADQPWSSGPLADNTNFPKWEDGTAKVRSTTFAARQAFLATKVPPYGLTVGWYANTGKSILDWVKEWNFSTESKLGVDNHGQLIVWGLDESVDPSEWPRIEHVVDIFGRVHRSSGEERENVVIGSCDWDPDASKFRVGPIRKFSQYGIDQYKGREKKGDILESTILNQQSQWEWVLARRVVRLAVGITLYDIEGQIGLLDDKVGTGVRLTTIEGTGASGFSNRPMFVTRSRFAFSNRIVGLTLWDVQNVLNATRFPNGNVRMMRVTDGANPAPVTDTADFTAIVTS